MYYALFTSIVTDMEAFLTRRQKEILEFILEFREREGVSPTHREICDRFGYSSYGTVHKHLKLLREKGFLRRVGHQKRGIAVVEETLQSQPGVGRSSRIGGAGRSGAGSSSAEEAGERVRDLPFHGRIAAGRPIEALPGTDTLGVPPHLLAGGQPHYVLRVAGDSMIEEGIHDGDFVVVRGAESAVSGEMVVALIDGEATLKRYFPENGQVRLQPANAAMEPIWVRPDRLTIQGVVVGLMRKY